MPFQGPPYAQNPDPSTYKPNQGTNVVFSDGTTAWQRDSWAADAAANKNSPPVPYTDPMSRNTPINSPDNLPANLRNVGGKKGTAGETPAAVVQDKKEQVAAPKKLQFPSSDIDNMRYGMQFKFVKQSYEKYGDKAKFTSDIAGAHIFLPLPTSIMEALNVNYNISELGAAGTLFEAGNNTMDALVSGKFDGASPDQRSAMVESAVKQVMNVSGYVVRRLISGMSQETGQAVDLKYGQVTNPYTVAVFQSTTPRNHSLTFRLIPRTPQDSKDIQAIINAFKYHSMPSRQAGGDGTAGIFLRMPEEVEVCFYGTKFLYKFARCVIQSVSVNHTPFGTPSFFAGSDGAPTGVELTLALQEIEQLTKESYGDDHSQYAMV